VSDLNTLWGFWYVKNLLREESSERGHSFEHKAMRASQ
jgi:hypothetical protein